MPDNRLFGPKIKLRHCPEDNSSNRHRGNEIEMDSNLFFYAIVWEILFRPLPTSTLLNRLGIQELNKIILEITSHNST